MWRFKFLLIGMLISGALGATLFFVGRYVYDEFKAELEADAIAAVDDYFQDLDPAPITEERIVITERELTNALRQTDELSSAFDEQGLAIDLVPGEIRIVDADPSDGDPTNLASVKPTIVSGRVELGEPDGVVAIFVPMGTIADEIELQAFNIFNQNNVVPTSLEVTDRELIILVEPKPGTTLATPQATPRPGARTPTPSADTDDDPTETSARVTPVGTVSTAATATPVAVEPTATRTGPLNGLRTLTPTT